MSIYAGLDVSDKTTHVCLVDAEGAVKRRDIMASDPEVIAKWLRRHASELVRVVLETGPLSTFLYHGLVERMVPVECICARHAKGTLSARINKRDVHDAEGLAQLARTGWFKRVHMKASATHIDRAALSIRTQPMTARIAMANQLRGLLKLFGLRLGQATTPRKRAERLATLYRQRPDLEALFAPLVICMEAIEKQLRTSSHILEGRAAADPVCLRLMTVPGVGPITALTYTASIEDPHRFSRSEDVGAYAGLVPRRTQSGERDTNGHISKAGDTMLRTAL
jgi:transposase